jgi:hypothetical protein
MEHVIENSSCQVDDEKLVATKLKFLKLERKGSSSSPAAARQTLYMW